LPPPPQQLRISSVAAAAGMQGPIPWRAPGHRTIRALRR